MMLTSYGVREWGLISVVAIAVGAIFAWTGWWWAVAVVVVVWLAALSFFRDPPRRIPTGLPDGAMLSPADGRISRIERLDRHDATEGPALVVRIFLSVLNVHVNRSPCDGEVVSVDHRPGRYLDARSEESAKVNESTTTVLRTATGERVGLRQVSGAIARRIVCPLGRGDRLRRGQRFGMIKFGSTTELILPRPDDVDVRVREGATVKGGVTVLAVLRSAGQTARQG